MPDSNPILTASLMDERTQLLGERGDLLRRINELNAMLETNTNQIEATDTLMLRFNPDHVSLDVRTDLDGSPLVVIQRTHLQLASSTSGSAIEQASPQPTAPTSSATPAEAAVTASAKSPNPKKTAVGKPASKSSTKKTELPSTEEEAAELDALVAAKPERSPISQAMVEYFRKSNRTETVLQILRGMSEPVSAKTVAGHYRALFPLPEDSAAMRTLHNSRISSALHYLKDRGQTVRSAVEKGEGKQGETVFWTLSKSYRSELNKAGRKKINGHAPQTHTDAPQISSTTH